MMIGLLGFLAGAVIGAVWGPIVVDALERRALFRYLSKCKDGAVPPAHIRRIARQNSVKALQT